MNLLLDTSALLWWLAEDPGLSPGARRAIASPANTAWVSAATSWEISTKVALGKLRFDRELPAVVEANGFRPLGLSLEHCWAAGNLPRHHGDPFDRMLIAQALTEGLTIVTRDRHFSAYGVSVLDA
ncbi:MAG TPA: type II toxin-antitoxin system VapC family toxin [Acidimicrobiia bacterium]|nr:type II toxin-antitoxin system VapC family toxin [Acidimicrobiia bacterium]